MAEPTGSSPQPQAERPPQPQTPPLQPKPQPPGYEFTASQNQTVLMLAKRMKFVGVFYIVVGALVGLIGLVALFFSPLVGIVYILSLLPQLLIGLWTTNAATSFRQIVDTKGHDIPYLMNALASLRKLYTLQFWLLIIAMALIVLGIAAGVFLLASGILPIPVERTTVTLLAW